MSDLKWTKEAPRVAGYWWMRPIGSEQRDIVAVAQRGTGFVVWLEGDRGDGWVPVSKARYDDGDKPEWSGPIPEPLEDSDV